MQKDAGINVTRLAVDGGASRNNFLLQFQADILGCVTARPETVETTALGAAYLAGLCSGYWKSLEEIKNNVRAGKVFTPCMTEDMRKKLLDGWEKAVKKARTV